MTKFRLLAITCAVSLGGLLFGFDSGVISGCEEAIQREFVLSPFWHGLVVAGALIGTVFGALAAGRMCDMFGRKPTLVWMGVLFFVSAAVAYIFETRLFNSGKVRCISPRAAFITLCIIAALFVIFTFFTPTLGIFRDPITNSYGIE